MHKKSVVGAFVAVSVAIACAPVASAKPKPRKPATTRTAPASPSATASAQPSSSGGGSAGNWSLAEKEYWSKLQEEYDGYVKHANDRCGSRIAGTFNKETFRGQFSDDNGSFGLSGYARAHCEAGPGAIDEVCMTTNGAEDRANMAKSAVQSKISGVECKWGGKGKQSIDLVGKKLVVTIDPDGGGDNAASLQEKVKTFLKSKL